jgi:hypothetical protein
MDSTQKPKQTDDPHDFLVVAPDDVRVAPSDEELSNLLRNAARHLSDPQTHRGSDVAAGASIPSVDTTFRPAAAENVLVPGPRRSIGGRALRAFAALLLAACIGVAAMAWQSKGDVAKQIIAKWAPKFVVTSLLATETPGLSGQPSPPVIQAGVANAAPPQPAPLARTVAEGVAPTAAVSSDSAQLLQTMARDLATVAQEIEQLKASVEQLKASQQQMSRDVVRAYEAKTSENKTSEAKTSENKASEAKASEAKASEAKASEAKASGQNLRPRTSAPSPRPVAAPVRRPMPPFPPPQAAAAHALPQAAAPSVPRQVEPQPQATAQPQAEPELSPVPRPPMPLR